MIVGEKLTIEVRRERDRIVLTLHGELDLLAAPRLQSEIESDTFDAADVLVLDLDDVQFIDSAGLRVLLAAHEHTVDVASSWRSRPARRRSSGCSASPA